MAGGSDSYFYRNLNSSDATYQQQIAPTVFPGASDIATWGWTNSGYRPKEWNTNRTGTGTSYAFGAALSSQTSYYLIWEAETTYTTTDTELTSVADAIRAKGGTSSALVYPTGFVSAIGAIPSGGWTLLGDWDVTVNTTSTSTTTIATNTVQNLPWDGTTLFFTVVRDKAGRRSGYFTGQDSYGYNYIAANGGTATNFDLKGQVLYTISSGTNVFPNTSETNYGVFVGTIYKDGRVVIYARYKSSYSRTINGTYNVKLYTLTPYPNANPWTYSFS